MFYKRHFFDYIVGSLHFVIVNLNIKIISFNQENNLTYKNWEIQAQCCGTYRYIVNISVSLNTMCKKFNNQLVCTQVLPNKYCNIHFFISKFWTNPMI